MEFHIEPTGQQHGLWDLYTQLTFCYALDDGSLHPKIISTLKEGLKLLTASFPWIAGQVAKERQGSSHDCYVIKSFEAFPVLIQKDMRDSLPSYGEYTKSGFPIKLLDEKDIAPRTTLSTSKDSEPKPVFLVQATFITGGLLLTFAGQHGTMDMVGQGEVIKLLSKACQGIPFSPDELKLGNQDRRNVIPLIENAEGSVAQQKNQATTQTQSEQIPKKPVETHHLDLRSLTAPRNTWSYFSFPVSSLTALKANAMSSITPASGFVSTDDALSAFIWQRISYARLARLEPSETSTFERTVDVRRYLNIATSYPGNLVTKTFTTYSFQQLQDASLGFIASQLRLQIDPQNSSIAYDFRATATALAHPSETNKTAKRSRDLSKDIAFSSWSKLDYCYDLDFNLGLGKPEAVKRPSFAPLSGQPMEGLVYLMPKRPDGEISVAVCLRDEDLERLQADGEWVKYSQYVG